MRSAPTLKIWMTPFASVAMLEKLALLKIALCRAPALSSASVCRTFMLTSVASGMLLWTVGICPSFHLIPTLYYDRCRRQRGCHPSSERTGSAAISGPGAGGWLRSVRRVLALRERGAVGEQTTGADRDRAAPLADRLRGVDDEGSEAVSYTHLRAHEP